MKLIVLIISLISFSLIEMAFVVDKDTGVNTEQLANDELDWKTDLGIAMKESNATKKPIFAFFTGSDWCGWCKKLQREVFAKQAFKTWAKDEVILLELDFPRRTQVEPALAQQNKSLAQAFQVRGYPTVWMFYASKKESETNINLNALGSLGYPSGAVKGKEEVLFIKNANAILAKAGKKS